jgi:hypothetical protein
MVLIQIAFSILFFETETNDVPARNLEALLTEYEFELFEKWEMMK